MQGGATTRSYGCQGGGRGGIIAEEVVIVRSYDRGDGEKQEKEITGLDVLKLKRSIGGQQCYGVRQHLRHNNQETVE
ncbi:hypothetical protein MUK42_29773 [Musa troglodytarum]|uniref:Uncharacterized protein n=1 Tax=Musa troglodytarum TaxID=320322 RepID=A0A9E7EZT6_9LILI|nr:hypothetical protein MUK42_29773 [Musa troglodytarum]